MVDEIVDCSRHDGGDTVGGQPAEACASLVLQTTTFLRAGLRFGVIGGATLTFDSDGERFSVSASGDSAALWRGAVVVRVPQHRKALCEALFEPPG